MLIYDLICDSQHKFEGWFRNSDDLLSQQERAILRCPVCDSAHVIKKLAAPNISKKSSSAAMGQKPSGGQLRTLEANKGSAKAYSEMQNVLNKVHSFIDSNFEDVGNEFASEALSMHKGEKEAVNIRGTASAKELKDLAREGVTALPLPMKPGDKTKLN